MKDHSHEVALARHPGARAGYIVAGHCCVALGVIGVFLPVMPTTVFLLGAAACYARGSAAFYNRLLNHRVFGSVIADWRYHRAMTVRAKATAIGFVWLGIGATVVFGVEALWLRLLLVGVAVGVTVFLVSVRTRR